jgi:hypothetical protein
MVLQSVQVCCDRSRDPSIQPTTETTTTGDPSRLFSSKFSSTTSTQPSIDTNAPTDALSMATFYVDSTAPSSPPSKSSEMSPQYLLCRFDSSFLSALESTRRTGRQCKRPASDQIIRNKPLLPSMPIRLHLPLCPRIYLQNRPTMQATNERLQVVH